MQIKINNKLYEADPSDTILSVCKRNGIPIPTLCAHPDLLPSEGVCRMCLVETSQSKGLVSSCTEKVSEGLEIQTETENVNRARKINLELLWADHAGKCASCKKNGRCELQNLAKDYKVDEFKFVPRRKELNAADELDLLKDNWSHVAVDEKNSSIARDSQYCIECRRCVGICRDMQTVEAYGTNYRSSETNVGTPFEIPLDCIFCGQCSAVCPTAAITEKDDIEKFEKALEDPKKMVVVQTAPSVRFTLGEEFGEASGTFWEGKLVAALKELGCDKVFDTVLGADLTIIEEAHELIKRIKNKGPARNASHSDAGGPFPMFTSCCPSWVLYIEKYYPEFIPNLSSCKSPQQMLAPLVKTYWTQKEKINPEQIVSVSIMPCTSKKYEAQREEINASGHQDVDIVLTVRELARLLRKKKIDPRVLKEKKFDPALGVSTGAGVLFAQSGGVMEAALRTAVEKITGQELGKVEFEMVRGESGARCAEIEIDGLKLRVAVVHEIKNAKNLLAEMKKGKSDYHFVEVMACPNGCIGGGGQPVPTGPSVRKARIAGVMARDKGMPIRKSHENPALKKIYKEFLGHPGSEKAEELLHT
ncbi:MAG: [FeFe] hydrogenase, group A, partial [Candidatus Moranbacteria bacterium]|nr:[FeFe] hydrogenase, group A [Candidatus Moranbacteria bacterium]